VLLLLLRPRLDGLHLGELWTYVIRVTAASIVTALAALFVYKLALLAMPIHTTSIRETVDMVIRVGAAILVATVVYFGFSKYLGTDDVVSLGRIVQRLRGRS